MIEQKKKKKHLCKRMAFKIIHQQVENTQVGKAPCTISEVVFFLMKHNVQNTLLYKTHPVHPLKKKKVNK